MTRNGVLIAVCLLIAALPHHNEASTPAWPTDSTLPADATLLPLPASLNCAETYLQREVSISWYDTAGARDYGDLANDDIDSFDLPFPFIFYGVRYKSINISSNGWVSFTELITDAAAHSSIPSVTAPNAMIAGYWADLNPTNSTIYLETFGNEPDRVYVITYEDVPRNGSSTDRYTFQIVLKETNNIIRIQWLSQQGNTFNMAIGIEDETGTAGHQFTRLTPIDLNGRAIEYVPTLPALPSCANQRPLTCGANLTAQSMGSANNASSYGCSLSSFNGFEVLYTFTVDAVTLIDLSLTNGTARNTSLFLMPACDRCNCIAGATSRIRRVIGPGTYSVVVDASSSNDSGTFNLSLGCETLLGEPTGYYMQVDGCSLALDFDPFADGHGVWLRGGWFYFYEERNAVALRVDGTNTRRYSTNVAESACTAFDWMSAWVDDVTDKAVVYWQAPEGIIIHTVQGHRNAAGCCGVVSSYRVINTDTQGHWYELRDLRSIDLGPGQSSCSGRMEGAYLQVGTNIYTTEQNLTCEATGVCATTCAAPANILSLENLAPRLSVQTLGNSAANAVHGEWVIYWDVDRPCDGAAPALWQNGYLPIPDPTDICWESDALLYVWTMRPGGAAIPAGGSYTVTQTLGDGCSLATQCPCFAIADIQTASTIGCTNNPLTLDGGGSGIPGCTDNGGTLTYEWLREGATTGVTTPRYAVIEAAAGNYSYALTVRCTAPGYTCEDTRDVQIEMIDCSQCSIASTIEAPWVEACQGVPVTLDSSGSTVTGCPSTPTYSWTKNGNPLPDTGATLPADVSTVGTSSYAVTVNCPLPGGATCSDSAVLAVDVNDCSSCAATAALSGNTVSVCIGSAAVLDATASTVSGCPGSTIYRWRRNGSLLPDTTSTISPTETVAGPSSYEVTVECQPTAGQCSGTSQPWLVNVVDCSTCDIQVDLVGEAGMACIGTRVTLDSRVVVANCPGIPSYNWTRDSVALPDTTPTIAVTETAVGQHTYTFSASCDPPPTGLACSAAGLPWLLDIVDCSSCAITADLTGDTSSVCTGTPIVMSAAGSVVTGCPGTTVFQWTRNLVPLVPTTATIPVVETVPGNYLYDVNVRCGPPPLGANCSDMGTTWPLAVFNCSGCSVTADLSNSPSTICVSTTTNLTSSASTITNCLGTVRYSWQRNGVPVGGSTPTLAVSEPVPTVASYGLSVHCDPPPTGLVCPPSQTTWPVTVQDCACSITAGIAANDSACTGQTVVLDALAGSTVIACSGTLSFEWTEDGNVIPGATAATLDVTSAVATTHDYTVRVVCSTQSCEDTSGVFTVTWTVGAPPGDLGNTLRAVRQGMDLRMVWQQDSGGLSLTYELLRGTAKRELLAPGPPVAQSQLAAPSATDLGAVASPSDFYYRVRGESCPGLVGPY